MQSIAENLWIMRFPLRLPLAIEFGRVVTLIRLSTGDLVIHSSAPFTPADVLSISALGNPEALVEATLFHDTTAKHAQAMFPTVPYFAPEGFSRITGVSTQPLAERPKSWARELEVLELAGIPKLREHVFFHRPSRTVIVADLVFNFPADAPLLTRFVVRWVAGLKRNPGVSRVFAATITDGSAFTRSIRQMMLWDFDRVIVGHGEVIETGGKALLREALLDRGY